VSGELPPSAAWRHQTARDGFEVVHISQGKSGCRFLGHTAAVEDRQAWELGYDIQVDQNWQTREAHAWLTSERGLRDVWLETDGSGSWQVNGSAATHLDGCFDVDLESSACTNMLPVHRLQLDAAGSAEAPAAYVHLLDLGVERLDQHYSRLEDDGDRQRYDYAAPTFDFECRLVYDQAGLVLDYPGIARRVL
jgi:hypothetical protein